MLGFIHNREQHCLSGKKISGLIHLKSVIWVIDELGV